MATYDQILSEKLPGQGWTMTGDSYDNLVWMGPGPPPSKETLEEWGGEVDVVLAIKEAAAAQVGRFTADDPSAGLRGFEILAAFCLELYRLLPEDQKTAFDAQILADGQQLRDRISDIRAGG